MLRSRTAALVLALAALGVGACATYRDHLARGQRAFDQSDHDRALASLRDLEPDLHRLSDAEQAEYAYLRGMTDYRIGYKADARHWLAIAKAYEETTPGVLPADWKARATEALDELNEVVYAQGLSALASSRRSPSDKGAARGVKKSEPAEAPSNGAPPPSP